MARGRNDGRVAARTIAYGSRIVDCIHDVVTTRANAQPLLRNPLFLIMKVASMTKGSAPHHPSSFFLSAVTAFGAVITPGRRCLTCVRRCLRRIAKRSALRDKMATTTAVSRERRARDDEQDQSAAALRDDYADDNDAEELERELDAAALDDDDDAGAEV